ncbi:hypothetical protein B5X24_HaOG212347 [Helicoverpa armigera]|nr:uncharacterized protein LOC110372655 [Helicoverpa armigera]PZC81641.1 hypothetical protein B5X24_HaOG212347 [Helicoverpa armigera]
MGDAVHVKVCEGAPYDEDEDDDPPHPCDDPPRPCNPFKVEGDCPFPYLCFERLKNPSIGTKCLGVPFMHAKICGKKGKPTAKTVEEGHHPCDPLPPCSTMKKMRTCREPALCFHRIKNPEWPKKPITSDCNPDL